MDIVNSNIVNSVLLNKLLSEEIDDWKPFIPTYDDIRTSLKYWLTKRYPKQEIDNKVYQDIDEFIGNNGGYEKYYNFVSKRSTNVWKVVCLFYDSTEKWLEHRCRIDKSIKKQIIVDKFEEYKYYDSKSGNVKIPYKYIPNENWLEIMEYGAKRSDRWISVKSKNGNYCLWMPRKVKTALATYYKKNGARKTREFMNNNYIGKMFDIDGNWNNIKTYLSKEKDILYDENLIIEYGSFLYTNIGEKMMNNQNLSAQTDTLPTNELHKLTTEDRPEPPTEDSLDEMDIEAYWNDLASYKVEPIQKKVSYYDTELEEEIKGDENICQNG